MSAPTRYALIVGVSAFDDTGLSPLPGCAIDLAAMSAFASDPARGYCDTSTMASPTRSELLDGISELFEKATNSDGLALLYIATHGVTRDLYGLALCCKDTRTNRLAATTISIGDIYRALSEYACRRTVVVIDACEAGGAAAGASLVARDKLLRDLDSAARTNLEGHYIFASCGTRESSGEDSGGGEFTQHFLASIESAGGLRTSDEWLPAEVVAGELIRTSGSLGQTPEWTGLSISIDVPLCKNRQYDASVAAVGRLIASADAGAARPTLESCIHAASSSLARIGRPGPWSGDALHAAREISASALPPDTKDQFWRQTSMRAMDKIAVAGTNAQRLEAMRYLEEVLVLAAGNASGIIDSALCDLAASVLAPLIADSLLGWCADRAWFNPHDGTAAFAQTCLRYWDALCAAATAGMFAHAASRSADATRIFEACATVVRQCPLLHRVVWAGQYPDIIGALTAVARVDLELAHGIATQLVVSLAERTLQMPPALLTGKELGREIASQIFGATTMTHWYADEGIAAMLAFLYATGYDPDEVLEIAAAIDPPPHRESFYLYVAVNSGECSKPLMNVVMPADFPNDRAGATAMVKSFAGSLHSLTGPDALSEALIAIAGAAVYRNRTGIEAVAVMVR